MSAVFSPGRAVVACALAVSIALAGIVAAPSAALAYDDPVAIDGMVLDAHGQAIVNDVTSRSIAPGLEQISFERIEESGRNQVNVLKVKLGAGSGVHAGYVGPDTVANTQTLTTMADDSGAIAAINGDQFDINNSGAPLGVTMKDGELLKSGIPLWNRAAIFDKDGLGRVAQLLLTGSVVTGEGTFTIQGVNVSEADTDVVALYNSNWGAFSRGRILFSGETGVEVLVDADGKVSSVSDAPGSGQLPDGVQALVARPGAAADALRKLSVGDGVDIEYSLNKDAENAQTAIGGYISVRPQLVVDGVPGGALSWDEYATSGTYPRTAVGFSEDGATAYFVQVDGRSARSVGMSFQRLGEMLVDFGAYSAIALDSGGSSQMNVRTPGDAKTSVVNLPSDGSERHDANGIGLFLNTPSSGIAASIDIHTRIADVDAVRVFPGLTRTLTGVGVDESGNGAGATASWSVDNGTVTEGSSGAILTGGSSGTAIVTATSGAALGTTSIAVLGPLQRLTASTALLALPGVGAAATVTITGHDADGFEAPIEPDDVQITDLPDGVLDFQPAGDGTYTVTALTDSGAATPTFTVGGQQVRIPITVGTVDEVATDLSDASTWTSARDRGPDDAAELGVTATAGPDGRNGLKIAYDFTASTGTRGEYAIAPGATVAQKKHAWLERVSCSPPPPEPHLNVSIYPLHRAGVSRCNRLSRSLLCRRPSR